MYDKNANRHITIALFGINLPTYMSEYMLQITSLRTLLIDPNAID